MTRLILKLWLKMRSESRVLYLNSFFWSERLRNVDLQILNLSQFLLELSHLPHLKPLIYKHQQLFQISMSTMFH